MTDTSTFHRFNPLNGKKHTYHISGQIIIFHQPGFSWNKEISLPKRYLLGGFSVVFSVAIIIWPDISHSPSMTYLPTSMINRRSIHVGKYISHMDPMAVNIYKAMSWTPRIMQCAKWKKQLPGQCRSWLERFCHGNPPKKLCNSY